MITVSSIEASIIRGICFFPDAAAYKCGEETLTLTADFNYNDSIHRRGNHIRVICWIRWLTEALVSYPFLIDWRSFNES